MKKQWNIFTTLRQLFKDDRNEFQRKIEQINFYEINASGQFSSLYTTLLSLKPFIKQVCPDNETDLKLHEDLTATLVHRAYALRGRYG